MDILLDFNGQTLTGDIQISGLDLASDDGLRTAIIMSLFTDARALDDDELPAEADSDRRGWWGDLLADEEGDRTGSRLWLLSREKMLPNLPARAEELCQEALAWLIEDGVASGVDVAAERRGMDGLAISITAHRPSGSETHSFEYVWEAV